MQVTQSVGENYVLVLLKFSTKEWFVVPGLLLMYWFRQESKQDTVGPWIGLSLSGLEAALLVKGNGDKQSGSWMNEVDLERVIRV